MINEKDVMDAECREENHEHSVLRGSDVPLCIQNETRNDSVRGTGDSSQLNHVDSALPNGEGNSVALNLSVPARDIDVKKPDGDGRSPFIQLSTENTDLAPCFEKEPHQIHTERGEKIQSSSYEMEKDSLEAPAEKEFGKCSFSDIPTETINSPSKEVSEPDQTSVVTVDATSNQPSSTGQQEASSAASPREKQCESSSESTLVDSPKLVCSSQFMENEPVSSDNIKNVIADSASLVPLASHATDLVTSHPQLLQSTSLISKATDSSESLSSPVRQDHSFPLPASKCVDTDSQHSIATSRTISSPTTPSLSVSLPTSKSSLLTNNNNVQEEASTFVSVPETCLHGSITAEGSEHKESDGGVVASDSQVEVCSPSSSGLKNQESPYKILTKYIFINKPDKVKSSKKRLGVLYKQAFRYFQKSKFNSLSSKRKHCKVNEKKRRRNHSEDLVSESVEPKAKKRKGGNNKIKKMTKRNGLKSKKARSIPVEKKSTVKSDETTSRRKSPRRAGQRGSRLDNDSGPSYQGKEKSKTKTRKSLSLMEKADIITQLESPSVSFSSIASRYSVSKSSLARIVKQKDKILAQLEGKGKKTKKVKKADNVKKTTIMKEPVIKIERCDDEVNEDEIDFKIANVDMDNSFSEDTVSSHPDDNSSVGKSRKELTLEEKVRLIQAMDKPGIKVKHVADKFGVSRSAASRMRKHKDRILSRSLSGDACHQMKRTRECKDPVLDKALLKWYRAIEALKDHPISISNPLLQDKAKDIALAMGRSYYPLANWIIRWKYRHNIVCKSGRIESKDILDELDANVDMVDIIMAFEGQSDNLDGALKTENGPKVEGSEKIVCEHCGIVLNRKRDRRRTNHLKTCPLSSQRHELTLGEKAQVVRALEKPGTKKVTLAKKYGVSSSAISRMYKNRANILARCARTYVNVGRKRERGCKEPEVERALCDWYHQQQEYGYHASGSTIREKAHEIAALMGKNFWPSESWVFRWRHRNNFNLNGGFEEMEEDDDIEEITEVEANKEATETENEEKATSILAGEENQQKEKKNKKKEKTEDIEGEEKLTKPKLPRSVMCEKCGCVSSRLKNNRIRNMKHAKGCPDLKPRNELTYQERMKMLKALEEPGATLSSVARQYGISASSMSRMNQKKDSILTRGMDYAGHKRIRDCKEPEVAKLLYDWFIEKQDEGIHVTGTKLKEKAASLALEMGREFKASTGWLGRWKHRYNVIYHQNQKDEGKNRHDVTKRKTIKKKDSPSLKQEEAMESAEENHQDNINTTSIMAILPEEVQPLQAPRMFLNQHYQTPWNQPSASCARPKDFIPAPNHGVPEESHVPYAYDQMSRQMFHNMFENFASAASYPVSMVEPSVPVRDYLQPDENEPHLAGSSHHPILHHQAPPLNLHSSALTSQQHHARPLQQPLHHSSHSPVTSDHDGDSVQQQQIMEACKLMNSFAKEKALGEHIQAAIRTIEMSIKGGERKGSLPQTTYTHI